MFTVTAFGNESFMMKHELLLMDAQSYERIVTGSI